MAVAARRGLLSLILLFLACGGAQAGFFEDVWGFFTDPFGGLGLNDAPSPPSKIDLPSPTNKPIALVPSTSSPSPPPTNQVSNPPPVAPVAISPPITPVLSPPPPTTRPSPPVVILPDKQASPAADPTSSTPITSTTTTPLTPVTVFPEKHKNKPPPPSPPKPSGRAGTAGSPSGSSSSSTTTIIIAVACSVGGVILIVVMTLLCCYFKRKKKLAAGAVRAAGTAASRKDLEQGRSKRGGQTSHKQMTGATKSGYGAYASQPSKQYAKGELQSFDPFASSYNTNSRERPVASSASAPTAQMAQNAPERVNKGVPMGPMAAAAAASTITALRPPVPQYNQRDQLEVSSPAPRPNNNATARWLGLNPATGGGTTAVHKQTASQTDSLVSKSSRLSSSYDIDFSSVQLDREVGKGSFGKIFKATWNETPVAVKFLVNYDPKDRFQVDISSNDKFQQQNTEKLMQALEAEAELLSVLRHPNVVQYLGTCTDPGSMCIVTEYCGNGSLADVIRKKELTWDVAMRMLLDAATGMLYLHSRNILHCDLKSNNILVDTHYRTKICDLNMSKLIEESTGSSVNVQNPRWLAPEICEGSDTHSKASDVYSFAIVMWEVLTGQIPWRDSKPWEIVQLIKDGGRPTTPNFWDCLDARGNELIAFDEYVQLMSACWDGNSYSRPSFNDIVRELKEIVLFTSGGRGEGGAGGGGGECGEDDGAADPRLFSNSSTKVFFSNVRSK